MRASVIFWGILLWFILFVPFVSFPLDISINPDKELLIDVPYGEDQGKGKLEISNNGNNEIGVEIKASGLTQKGSDRTANLSFSEKEEKTKLNITLKKSETKEITLIASNINVTEEFTGTIQFNAGAEKPELNVTVKKSKPLPPIELEDLTDGKLKLVMDSPYKLNYEFKLKNPEGSIYRELELKDIELQNDGKVITGVISLEGIKANVKKNISLEPGESKKVFISFQPLPGKGIYVGTLVINDFKNNRIEKEFGVSLECPYITFKKIFDNTWITTWAVVFCLVLLGALCSFLLMKLVPISSDKRKNREKIVLLDEQIQQIKPNLKNLKTKFAVGLIKSKTLNDNTKMWTLSASERLKTVSTNLEGIESQLSIVKKIENIYNDIDSRDFIPFSKEQDIRVILKDAQLYLYQDKTDVVDNILKEVDDLLKFNSSDGQVVKNYFNNLNDNIEKLEAELKGENICIYDLLPELSIVQKFDEIKKLKADTAKLEERINTGITDFIKDLRDWDLTYNKLSIYKKFSKILDEEQYGKQKEEVKNFLESDQYEDIDNAIALCESLKIHVSMEDIECAIENKKYHIVYDPPDPDVDGLITFELQFDDEKLN
ncbi:MAG: hypothetical protein QG641_713, partial [Candidatus Poribacteria bacterium]|nr:hypothetical protein [Candidatus Poribacteria bacterium]